MLEVDDDHRLLVTDVVQGRVVDEVQRTEVVAVLAHLDTVVVDFDLAHILVLVGAVHQTDEALHGLLAAEHRGIVGHGVLRELEGGDGEQVVIGHLVAGERVEHVELTEDTVLKVHILAGLQLVDPHLALVQGAVPVGAGALALEVVFRIGEDALLGVRNLLDLLLHSVGDDAGGDLLLQVDHELLGQEGLRRDMHLGLGTGGSHGHEGGVHRDGDGLRGRGVHGRVRDEELDVLVGVLVVQHEELHVTVGDLVASLVGLVTGNATDADRSELGQALGVVERGHGDGENLRTPGEEFRLAGTRSGGVSTSGDGDAAVGDAAKDGLQVGGAGAPVAMLRAVDAHRAALTGDVGLDREGERTELVNILVIVFRFKTGITHIGSRGGVTLQLGVATLLVLLDLFASGTALGIVGGIVAFHIGGRIGRGGHLHRIYCHCKTGICTQQSRSNHKEG